MSRLIPTPGEIQKHLVTLEETPRRIAACTQGLAEERLSWKPEARLWSPVEVLAHLRGCEDLWSFSIYAMLSQDNPCLALLDERRWAKIARYSELEFQKSFQAFALKRLELLNVLRALPEEAWLRTADIGGRKHSVYSQARRMAKHESEHCDQIAAILGTLK